MPQASLPCLAFVLRQLLGLRCIKMFSAGDAMTCDSDPRKILRKTGELIEEAKVLRDTAARLSRETVRARAAAGKLRARRKRKQK